MKSVLQDPDENECGASCFAMLAGLTLKEARTELYGHANSHRLGREDILDALRKFGKPPLGKDAKRITRTNALFDLQNDALVYARALISEGRGHYSESHHWVVWDATARVIRDPLGYVQPLKLTSYTEIK